MRVVVFNVIGSGHVNPTLPVVRGLVERGAEVTYFTSPERRDVVERAGATLHNYGRDDFTVADYHPKSFFPMQLLPATAAIVPYLLEVTEPLRPDVILTDSMAPWGLVVAEVLGVPVVGSSSSFTPGLSEFLSMKRSFGLDVDDENRAAIATITERWGVAFDPEHLGMHFAPRNLVYTTESFNADVSDRTERFEFVGAMIRDEGTGREPFEPFRDASRTRIYLSMGTVLGKLMGLGETFYAPFFEAFGHDDRYRLVVSVGRGVDTSGWKIPEGVVVRDHVPQLDVLRSADVFVSHCGMNSGNEAGWFGVPMLCLPGFGDQPMVARRVEELGAGLRLDWLAPASAETLVSKRDLLPLDPAALRADVERLTTAPFREAAARLREAHRAAPGVRRAVEVVEEEAGRRPASRD